MDQSPSSNIVTLLPDYVSINTQEAQIMSRLYFYVCFQPSKNGFSTQSITFGCHLLELRFV